MAEIPGPIIFIVGLIVSGVSFFINKKSFAFIGAYSLFLYLGVIIILYGFVKILIWYMTRESKEDKKAAAARQAAVQNAAATQNAASQPARQDVFDKIQQEDPDENRYRVVSRCPTCGLLHYSYANFCSNCGARLR